MASIGKFQKAASDTFTPSMESLGFAYMKYGYYIRRRGPLHDVIMVGLLRDGETLRVYAVCWTPAGADADELARYPKCIGVVLGDVLGENGLGRGAVWDFGTPEINRKTLDGLLLAVKKHALPWFGSINTVDQYLEKFKWMRGLDRDFRERVKAELPRIFGEPQGQLELATAPTTSAPPPAD